MGGRKKTAQNAVFHPSAAQAAQARDASNKRAIAQAPIGIFLIDKERNCTCANLNLLKMAGSRKK